MQKILKFFETPIGLVVLGAVLPPVPNFLKELGKMFRDFIKWCGIKICKLSKFIYQQICENLREIDFQAFSGNHLRNGSVLFVIENSELKYFRSVRGFDAVQYAYKSNQQKDPHNNLNTNGIIPRGTFMDVYKQDRFFFVSQNPFSSFHVFDLTYLHIFHEPLRDI